MSFRPAPAAAAPVAAVLALASAALAQAPAPATAPPPQAGPAPAITYRPVDPDRLMVIDTNKGRVLAELAPEVAPNHVERVRALAKAHFYDGLTFFRVIEGFMDQTGDPKNTGEGGSDGPNLMAEFTFRRGSDGFVPVSAPTGGEDGYVGVMPVHSQSSTLAAMTKDGKVSAWPAYCAGVLGAARDGEPDSANSQFFLMRDTYPALEKRYTAFGRVIAGQDVVRAIKTGEPVEAPQDRMVRVRMASDMPAAERPKIEREDPASPSFASEAARVRAAKGADFSICDVAPRVRGG